MVELIIKEHKVTKGKIRIGLDGESVVKRLKQPKNIKASYRSFDLLTYATNIAENLPIEIQFFWVRGHQDDKGKKLHTKVK